MGLEQEGPHPADPAALWAVRAQSAQGKVLRVQPALAMGPRVHRERAAPTARCAGPREAALTRAWSWGHGVAEVERGAQGERGPPGKAGCASGIHQNAAEGRFWPRGGTKELGLGKMPPSGKGLERCRKEDRERRKKGERERRRGSKTAWLGPPQLRHAPVAPSWHHQERGLEVPPPRSPPSRHILSRLCPPHPQRTTLSKTHPVRPPARRLRPTSYGWRSH